MDIAVANLAPVDELNAKLETALDHGEHVALVNFEQTVKVQKRRYRRLANTDGSDLFRFNQRNRHGTTRANTGQRSSRHPARGSAAHNDDMLDCHPTSPLNVLHSDIDQNCKL